VIIKLGGAEVKNIKQLNVDLDEETCKRVSLMAAHSGRYKKDIVKEAINLLYDQSFRKDENE
jgi:hypothetical protein